MASNNKAANKNKNKRELFIVWFGLLIAWLLMTIIPPFLGEKTGRLLFDFYDLSVYFKRGQWLVGNLPAISEYPQVPTLLFGIDRLLVSWLESDFQSFLFTAIFSLQMVLVLFLAFKSLLQYLPSGFRNFAYLLLLPPTLYFTYNRFDILPAYFCLVAYFAAAKRQWTMVGFILAIAAFTKWYPVLLFPAFFVYAKTIEARFQWKMVLAFAVTSTAILALSYVQGGLETILAPFQFHTSRSMELVSLPVLLDKLVFNNLGFHIDVPAAFLLFFILQISAPVLVLALKLDTLQQLTNYCVVAIGVFILFSRIWSPQWYLWLLPFLVLVARNKRTGWLVAAYSIFSYLSFPVIFVFFGRDSLLLQVFSLLTYAILIVSIVKALRALTFQKPLAFLRNAPALREVESV